MKILMIAPEPFFEPRGTPFSEYFRIQAICQLGHEIDLVTYPIGEDRAVEGLRIFRSRNPFFIKNVKTGPSFKKLILDFFLFFKVLGRISREKYQLIHTHEEANIMGVFFNKITKMPHLYDMHSSLVQQMSNFQFTRLKIVVGLFKMMERAVLRNAASVIVICRALYDYAANITEASKLTLIENFMDETPISLIEKKLAALKKEFRRKNRINISYAGTLEPYQGIPLLVDALQFLEENFHLLIIGGNREQIKCLREDLEKKGLSKRVHLLGRMDPQEIPYYLKVSDVLVSPRSLGTNIPLKIYSYLKSGVPVVATNLYTHTQSLNENIAVLVEPQPEALAGGIRKAVSEEGKKIAHNAVKFCRETYSPEKYLELVRTALKKACPERERSR